MAVFSYTALKKDGSKAAGELTANDRADAFRRLDRTGLQPISLKTKEEGAVALVSEGAKKSNGKPEKGKNEKTGALVKTGESAKEVIPLGPVKLKKNDIVMFTEELQLILIKGSRGIKLETLLPAF